MARRAAEDALDEQDLSDHAVPLARRALARAAACDGACGTSPNLGFAWLDEDGRVHARGSTADRPAWSTAISSPGRTTRRLEAELAVLTALPDAEELGALRAALRERGVARLAVLDPAAAQQHGALPRRWRAAMRRDGVELITLPDAGAWSERAREVHRKHRRARASERPFVTLKAATSLDGCVATSGGHSKWITGPAARKAAHRLRAQHGAIAVGVGTVLADDPQLDVRLVRGRDPIPVVFDAKLRTVAGAQARKLHRPGVILLHGGGAPRDRVARARALAMEPLRVRRRGGSLDVADALRKLYERGVGSLMVEGGAQLLASFVRAGLYDELWLFMAPRLLGGAGRPLLPGLDWGRVDRAPQLTVRSRRVVGDDLLWVCAPREPSAGSGAGTLRPHGSRSAG